MALKQFPSRPVLMVLFTWTHPSFPSMDIAKFQVTWKMQSIYILYNTDKVITILLLLLFNIKNSYLLYYFSQPSSIKCIFKQPQSLHTPTSHHLYLIEHLLITFIIIYHLFRILSGQNTRLWSLTSKSQSLVLCLAQSLEKLYSINHSIHKDIENRNIICLHIHPYLKLHWMSDHWYQKKIVHTVRPV